MGDEHFDEITEVRLPAKLFRRSVGISFDVGMYIYSNYVRVLH